MTNVPQKYQGYVTSAANALGIPAAVVAAQIDLESGFDPNAKSGAGAEGIAQFEPGTFASYGPKGGSPYNVADAFVAYVAYMKDLLHQEGGDLRKALEAYNAGPGNLPAGSGYASTILSNAGSGDVTIPGSDKPGTPPPTDTGTGGGGNSILDTLGGALGSLSGLGLLSGVTGISDVAQSIIAVFAPFTKIFEDFNNALTVGMHAIVWIVNPMNWVRILAGVVGGISVIAGAVLVAGSA